MEKETLNVLRDGKWRGRSQTRTCTCSLTAVGMRGPPVVAMPNVSDVELSTAHQMPCEERTTTMMIGKDATNTQQTNSSLAALLTARPSSLGHNEQRTSTENRFLRLTGSSSPYDGENNEFVPSGGAGALSEHGQPPFRKNCRWSRERVSAPPHVWTSAGRGKGGEAGTGAETRT